MHIPCWGTLPAILGDAPVIPSSPIQSLLCPPSTELFLSPCCRSPVLSARSCSQGFSPLRCRDGEGEAEDVTPHDWSVLFNCRIKYAKSTRDHLEKSGCLQESENWAWKSNYPSFYFHINDYAEELFKICPYVGFKHSFPISISPFSLSDFYIPANQQSFCLNLISS